MAFGWFFLVASNILRVRYHLASARSLPGSKIHAQNLALRRAQQGIVEGVRNTISTGGRVGWGSWEGGTPTQGATGAAPPSELPLRSVSERTWEEKE
ncbi:hypothetical protein RSAG8_04245, partial [Rhizoctonia solani AG-8 WAC10335]